MATKKIMCWSLPILVLALVGSAQPHQARQAVQVSAKPMSRIELLGLRAAGSSGGYLELRVRQRGLAFRPDERFLEDLRGTGPQNSLIETVRSARIEVDSAEHQDDLGIQAKLARCGKLNYEEHITEAEIECRAALALAPNNPILLSAVSFVLTREKKGEEALTFARRAAGLDSSFATAHLRVGAALEAIGDLDAADIAYHQVLELEPDNIDAMMALGRLLAEKKHDLEGAMARYREALRTQPNSVSAHYNLAFALHEKGDVSGEVAELQEVVRLAADFAEAHCYLGVALGKKGEHEAAMNELREAVRLRPDFPEAHYCLGDELQEKGDLEGAIAEWSQPARLHPDDADARTFLGTMLAAHDKLDAGIAELREAVRLDPKNGRARTLLGLALATRGDPDGAIVELHEALRLDPDNGKTHLALGEALWSKEGQHKEALSEFREAVRLEPAYSEAHRELGEALYRSFAIRQALLETLSPIMKAPTQDGKIKVPQIQGLDDFENSLTGAISEFREAVRLNPNDSEAHAYLGEALADQKELDAAVTELSEAVRLEPGSAEFHFRLGQALEQNGNTKAALEQYSAAVKLDPRNSEYKEARKSLLAKLKP